MILNEKFEDFFNSKETQMVQRMKSSQDVYNNLNNDLSNPYDSNYSEILDFTIKSDVSGSIDAKISGIIDYVNGQFVIKQLTVNNATDKVSIIKRLLNSIIVNLENEHPEVSTIYWRVNKIDTEVLKACLDKGFDIQDSNSFAIELTYYTMGSPIRQNYNSLNVHKLQQKTSQIYS